MKDYDRFINKQAEVLNEFDDFCEQFEKRAAENFKNPNKQDERFELLREISEPGRGAIDSIPGDTGTES
jgi:hypothetical protein